MEVLRDDTFNPQVTSVFGGFYRFQILFWTISGLYFSWNEIEAVRGEHLAVKQSGLFQDNPAYLSPSKVISAFVQQRHEIEMIDQVTLRSLMGEPVYEIRYRQVERSGTPWQMH